MTKPDFTKHWETRQYVSKDESVSFTINDRSAVICTPEGNLTMSIGVYEALMELECDAATDKLRQAVEYRRKEGKL